MLIFTRPKNQSVFINDDTKVIVLGIESGQVRLGFEAPGDVEIMREEFAGEGLAIIVNAFLSCDAFIILQI